jgi:hypothetical protein
MRNPKGKLTNVIHGWKMRLSPLATTWTPGVQQLSAPSPYSRSAALIADAVSGKISVRRAEHPRDVVADNGNRVYLLQ